MRILLNESLKNLLDHEDAVCIAKMLGYYMDVILLTEEDVVKATSLYHSSKGYIPQKWGYVIKCMLEARTPNDDESWTIDLQEMISNRKKVAK